MPETPTICSDADSGHGTMKISVVVPMYNEGDHAHTVVQSIVEQSISADVEILVCDDASTDDTGAILEQLSYETLRVLHNRTNRGIANTLSRLTSEASGEYLIRIDGDSKLQPGGLESLYTELKNGADLVFGHIGVWKPITLHERIVDANRDLKDNPSYGGACVGMGLDIFKQSGGWTLRDGGHRNDETTELKRRAQNNGWEITYIQTTLVHSKFPSDYRGIAVRKFQYQWMRDVIGQDGTIRWHLVRGPVFWSVLGLSVGFALLLPIAWLVVVGLGLVWGVFQFRRALGVASHTNQIRDIPLYLVYQLGSGVLRTVGAYVGLVGWVNDTYL